MIDKQLSVGRGTVYFHSSETIPEVADGSVRVAFASPPFTNNPDGKTLDKAGYLEFARNVFAEVYRALVPGGVLICLNTDLRDHASYNRGDRSFDGTVWHKHDALRRQAESVGFKCFDHKIWVKSEKENLYRYNFSHILFYSKPGGSVLRAHKPKHADGFGPDIWRLQDSMQRRDSQGLIFRDAIHPEIVKRCVDEFSCPGEVVLSPFVGSGTICATAELLGRDWIGYEINTALTQLIRDSVVGPRPEIYQALEYEGRPIPWHAGQAKHVCSAQCGGGSHVMEISHSCAPLQN
jgi:DNA modification methylase